MKEHSSHNNNKQKNIIYYICIGDLLSRRLIVDYFPQEKGNQQIFKDYARNIIDRILTISLGPSERYKETLNDNKKFNVTTDSKANISFMILTNDSFPERYSYKLLMELETKSITIINKHYLNKVILDVLDRAENFKTFENDKIGIIQEDVDDLKIDIKNNIDKMLTNIEMVSTLEEKSNALKNMAKEYKTGTKELKRASWRRNKYTVVAGGISLGALLYFGARYFIK